MTYGLLRFLHNPSLRFAAAAVLIASVTTGCPDDPAETQDAVSAELQCRSDEWLVARPLSGPGLNDDGTFVGPLKDNYRIHATQIVVREKDNTAFLEMTAKVSADMDGLPGLIGFGLSFDPVCKSYGTVGIWESDEAMTNFVLGDVHREAMDRAAEFTDFARVTSWTATASEAQEFNWPQADDRLKDIPDSRNY